MIGTLSLYLLSSCVEFIRTNTTLAGLTYTFKPFYHKKQIMAGNPTTAQDQQKGLPADGGADSNAPGQGDTKKHSRSSNPERQITKSKASDGKKSSAIPSKRKAKTSNEPSKAPRRSARGAPKSSVDPAKMIQFLLSSDSVDLCRPKDEIEDLRNRGDIRTYSSSSFSPFEELICAVILSRPISHALGLRSIRTIFNNPYNFTTPKALREAGSEGRREALDTARTQHRQKTADELGLLADQAVWTIGDGEDDVSLEKVRRDGDRDPEKVTRLTILEPHDMLTHRQERDILKKNIKGLGKTGLENFGRRIQGIWPAFYPFVDSRTSSALEKLGLPGNAEELMELMEKELDSLDVKDVEAKDDEEKKRKVFVRILERAVGADLEGNAETVKSKLA